MTKSTGNRKDPFMAYNFEVEVDALIVAGVTEISGLQIEIEVKDYQEGGQNSYVHQLPGPIKTASRITLKRGMTNDPLVVDWLKNVGVNSLKTRKAITIYLKDTQGKRIYRWLIRDAFPVKWIGPQFRANASGESAVAFETVELAHHGIILQSTL